MDKFVDNPDIDVKPKVSGTRQLFNNSILEFFTRTHIAVPVSIFVLYATFLLYWSITRTTLPIYMTAIMFGFGFIAFTWIEYNVHRHLFHMATSTAFKKKLQYLIHGVHHEYPKDKKRLAMPPILSISIATLLLLVFRWIMGDLAFSFMPGFLSGYAAYLLVHYLVHAFPPPKNYFKILWVNHAVHHHKDVNTAYGVSSPFWDYIYGTNQNTSKKR